MSITLHLPPEIEAVLIAEAEARGMPVDSLLEELVRRFAEVDTPVQPNTAGGLEEEALQDTLNALRNLAATRTISREDRSAFTRV
jgi:hypothetical protein